MAKQRAQNWMAVAIPAVLAVVLVIGIVAFLAFRMGGGDMAKAQGSREERPVAVQEAPTASPSLAGTEAVDVAGTEAASGTGSEPAVNRAALALSGVVIDASTGEPVHGATLLFYPPRHAHQLWDDVAPSATARTGADGRFALDAERVTSSTAMAVLVAQAQGLASQAAVLRMCQDEARELEFRLGPGASMSGIVVDEEGTPVEGARIGLPYPLDQPENVRRDEGCAVVYVPSVFAVSGPGGAIALEGLPAGEAVSVPAVARGFPVQQVELAATGQNDEAIVLKAGGARLHGTVRSERGEPVAGATIEVTPMGIVTGVGLVRQPQDPDMGSAMLRAREVRTDAAGTYLVAGLPVGWQVVRLFAPGQARAPNEPIHSETLELAESESRQLDFVIPTVQPITGRAVDIATGRGVAGLRVLANGAPWFPSLETQAPVPVAGEVLSGADGVFRLRAQPKVAGGKEVVEFEAFPPEGWNFVSLPPYGSSLVQKRAFSEAVGEPGTEIIVGLVPAVTRTVLFMEPDGMTEARSQVGGTITIGDERPQSFVLYPAGTLTLRAVAGTTAKVEASGPSGSAAVDVEMKPDLANEVVRVVLGGGGVVSGTVKGADGKGIADVEVVASRRQMPTTSFGNHAFVPQSAMSGSDGAYRIEGVQPGARRIIATPPEGYLAPAAQNVDVVAGQEHAGVDFTLVQAATFEGIVADLATQEPLAGVEVRYRAGGQSRRARTDDDGRWIAEAIPADVDGITVTIRHEGYLPYHEDSVPLDASPHVAFLDPGMHVEVVAVRDADGTPVENYTLHAHQPFSQSIDPFFPMPLTSVEASSPDGLHRLTGLRPGTVLELTAIDNDPASRTHGAVGHATVSHLELEPGMRVELRLAPSGAISGIVVDSLGIIVPEALVSRMRIERDPAGKLIRQMTVPEASGGPSGPGGLFRINGLGPGEYQLQAAKPPMVREGPVTVHVGPGESVDGVELVLVVGGTLEGRVLDGEGNPVEGATVSLLSLESHTMDRADRATGRDGAYQLTSIAPGAYNATALTRDGRSVTEAVEIVDGEVLQRDLQLSAGVLIEGVVRFDPSLRDRFVNMRLTSPHGDVPLDPDPATGAYTARVQPATHNIVTMIQHDRGTQGYDLGEDITIEPEPLQQRHDFTVALANVGFTLQAPPEAPLAGGLVTIASITHPGLETVLDGAEAGERALLDFGQYFALWTSPSDPAWIGESAPFTVGLGLPTTIPVVIRRDVPTAP